jgi:D-alanyl-D-alanine carboxypeptidase/D-alanyl-D-alanine-endopeptidase (penicillin-binding protein 4)
MRAAMLRMPLASVLLALAAANPAAALDDPLPAPVAQALDAAGLPHDALAAIAIPRTRWARTWQYRADAAVQPGSTMKLVTTVVALDQLGPNHRGRTELLATGAVDAAGVLQGDLVLKGGADPDLDLPALWQMLRTLREERGAHTIGGRVVLDRTLFRPARIDLGLPPFDDAPEWPYNVIPDALMLEGALMSIALASDANTVQVRTTPPLDGVRFDTRALALTERACDDWDEDWQPPQSSEPAPGQWLVTLRGGFPRRCEARASLQLLDRDVMAERQVRAVWASLGGRWLLAPGSVVAQRTPADAQRIALHESRPWGEVLRHMNKASDNPHTRLLYLQLGLNDDRGDAGASTLDNARRAVERWFDARGIDRTGLVTDNGSGLSRSERIAPRTTARMLDAALDGKHAPELLMSLPVAGVDGTMRRRLKGTPAEGWARLKTGTLANVRALAGTVRDTRGDTWVVAMMINHERAGDGRAALDALVEWIARSGARWR